MTRQPDVSLRSRLEAQTERQLTPAEIEAYLATPVTDAERDEVLAEVRWFRARFATGAERLAYVRRAYRRWTRPAEHSPTAPAPDTERGTP